MGSKVKGESVRAELEGIVTPDAVCTGEPMAKHTTFRIGGPADYLVMPHSVPEILEVIAFCKNAGIPYYVIGNGSNLLVSDEGIRGVVIRLGKEFGRISVNGTTVTAEAGALLSQTASAAAEASLTGMEFAGGIPGTVGGACVMNAGAYGGEMKQILKSVTALCADGTVTTLTSGELDLGYRTSIFLKKNLIVLSAEIELKRGEPEEIRRISEDLKQRRTSKQPLDLPSAGSTFKRPEGYFAGKLIMDAGLRGYRVGDAQVSEKHCGFVVNRGSATCAEVRQLIEDVSGKVYEQFGVRLEPEVRFLGGS